MCRVLDLPCHICAAAAGDAHKIFATLEVTSDETLSTKISEARGGRAMHILSRCERALLQTRALLWHCAVYHHANTPLPPIITSENPRRDAMIELQVACDGGKDSLSMAAAAGGETVMAPGNLVVSAYVGCPDITKVGAVGRGGRRSATCYAWLGGLQALCTPGRALPRVQRTTPTQ